MNLYAFAVLDGGTTVSPAIDEVVIYLTMTGSMDSRMCVPLDVDIRGRLEKLLASWERFCAELHTRRSGRCIDRASEVRIDVVYLSKDLANLAAFSAASFRTCPSLGLYAIEVNRMCH